MPDDQSHAVPTLFLLMAQYNGQTVVPIDQVCQGFFAHLTVEKLLRKALRGNFALPPGGGHSTGPHHQKSDRCASNEVRSSPES